MSAAEIHRRQNVAGATWAETMIQVNQVCSDS